MVFELNGAPVCHISQTSDLSLIGILHAHINERRRTNGWFRALKHFHSRNVAPIIVSKPLCSPGTSVKHSCATNLIAAIHVLALQHVSSWQIGASQQPARLAI